MSGASPSREHAPDVDQIVRKDAQPDPAFHAVGTFVAAAVQSVSSLHDADPAFTPGPPPLPVFEPAFLLFPLARGALGGPVRYAHTRDALRVGGVFIGRGSVPNLGNYIVDSQLRAADNG